MIVARSMSQYPGGYVGATARLQPLRNRRGPCQARDGGPPCFRPGRAGDERLSEPARRSGVAAGRAGALNQGMTEPTRADPPASSPGAEPPVLALIRDLMFSTRVTGTAKQFGIPVRVIRDPARLAGEPGRRLIVDLNLPGAIDAAIVWRGESAGGADVIGFVSHVDTATIQQARAAGIDRVMARSQFVQILPQLLKGELG